MAERTVPTAEVTDKAIAWLRTHPHASAREVAYGIGARDVRGLFHLLAAAERDLRVRRTYDMGGPCRWEVTTP